MANFSHGHLGRGGHGMKNAGRGMRLLIVGASGLIGKTLYRLAKERSIEVVGTATRQTEPEYLSYCLGQDDPEALLHQCNIGMDAKDTFAVLAGAVTSIKECYDKRSQSYAVNVEGTCHLARVLHEHGVKTIFLSSDAVFDGTRGFWNEKDAPNPLCEYGKQKAQAEEYLLNNIPDILVYRLSKQVVPSVEKQGLLREWFLQAMYDLPICCISGLKFQPTDVHDTVACILEGLWQGLTGIYHVANPRIFSRYELAQLFFQKINVSAKVIQCEMDDFLFTEPKALDTTMDISKFQSVIDYQFRSMESLIQDIDIT